MNGSVAGVQSWAFGHSSNVELTLVVNGSTHPLAQVGPGYVMLRECCELSPSDAEILLSVDGKQRRRLVRLPDGTLPHDRTAIIADR